MICADFQYDGITQSTRDRLMVAVKYWIAFGPRCLSMIGAKPSGRNSLDDFVAFMASATSSSVKDVGLSRERFFNFLFTMPIFVVMAGRGLHLRFKASAQRLES